MDTENKSKAYLQSPRVIKRNLKGINGSRFFNIPGVIYPEHVLKVKPGHNPQTGEPYQEKPAWGISSAEAGGILHCTASAARIALLKHKVRFHVVRTAAGPLQKYWNRAQVEKLAASRLPIATGMKQGYISMADAAAKLGVTRTSLQRYSERGLLHPHKCRIRTRCGLRIGFFFPEEEVQRLCRVRQQWQNSGTPTQPLESFVESTQQEGCSALNGSAHTPS